jgi:hypothetical protein
VSRFYQAACWREVVQDVTPCRVYGLGPFSKLTARFRHTTRSRLFSSSQSLSNQIVKSKTLLISALQTIIEIAAPGMIVAQTAFRNATNSKS